MIYSIVIYLFIYLFRIYIKSKIQYYFDRIYNIHVNEENER